MRVKTLWWYLIKYFIKSSLFFYTKRIDVLGKENIPKKGAVLFMVNHPNGLLDPLVVAVNNPRILHFLVRAAAFKKNTVKKFLATLNLMPIYRIRDGVKELGKNQEIFENCYRIFKNEEALMIFPEGSHDRRRTVRPLSKGFSRIVFGALERYPELQIHIVPVGLTYQNASAFPSSVSVRYGKAILANAYYNEQNQPQKLKELKEQISESLKKLSVHIPADDQYENTLNTLNKNNVDFLDVDGVNQMIKSGSFRGRKRGIHPFGFLKPLIILNSLMAWLIWKYVDRKNDEIEFIDTFRFGFNTILIPLIYLIQSSILGSLYGGIVGSFYFVVSFFLVLLYSKTHPVSAEKPS